MKSNPQDQDDIAAFCSTPKETTKMAFLVKDLLRFAGLACNEKKSFWIPTETKPLLGAIWPLNVVDQKAEATEKLQKLHEAWRTTRTLKDHQKFSGKLASLANFPGVTMKLLKAPKKLR
eukprot:GHVP01003051.1.p1 GENE.GHVP01003051.1~~GHVP01003051.1.p1  ORF type:complete len:119 (-),score=25.54 GHVP01003051.1:140-496(-)